MPCVGAKLNHMLHLKRCFHGSKKIYLVKQPMSEVFITAKGVELGVCTVQLQNSPQMFPLRSQKISGNVKKTSEPLWLEPVGRSLSCNLAVKKRKKKKEAALLRQRWHSEKGEMGNFCTFNGPPQRQCAFDG